jgi:hypothetical protein
VTEILGGVPDELNQGSTVPAETGVAWTVAHAMTPPAKL